MKIKPILNILTVTLLSAVICMAKQKQCERAAGQCVDEKSNCALPLPLRCKMGHICCQRKGSKKPQRSHRRICKGNTRKCEQNGGHCISYSANCQTASIAHYCPGASCKCCLKNYPGCKRTKECKVLDGFCINVKKAASICKGGRFLQEFCTGDNCGCCLPPDAVNSLTNSAPRECRCGLRNDIRIVGGDPVHPNKYPWVVGVLFHGWTNYGCMGALINDRYVLTAAHCFVKKDLEEMKAKRIKVALADHNQETNLDDVPGVTRLVEVDEILIHEKYSYFRNTNDIALLRLKEPLDLAGRREIRPVCLPKDKSETYEGADGTIAGWGLLDYDYGGIPDVLMKVTLPIYGPDCNGNEQIYGYKITDAMLCAGLDEGGKDSCSGDSGSSLVVEENGVYVTVGVTSFGFGCGNPDSPGVYARITKFLDWIRDNTKDANYCS